MEKTTREDQRIAKDSVNLFKKLSRSLGAGKKVVEISFPESDEPLRLPVKVVKMIAEILTGMSIGRSVAVIQSEMEISTQEAADFLEVSRPHVVRLLLHRIPFNIILIIRRRWRFSTNQLIGKTRLCLWPDHTYIPRSQPDGSEPCP